MIYTEGMRRQVKELKAPHDFVVEIVEFEAEPPGFIMLRFYESQWTHYNDRERINCILFLEKIRKIINAYGVRVTLDPVIDAGNSLPTKYKKAYGKGVGK